MRVEGVSVVAVASI